MASAIIHYTIANILLNRIDIKDKNQFLVGVSLGPDASSHDDNSIDCCGKRIERIMNRAS
jgi:hypothetical protein